MANVHGIKEIMELLEGLKVAGSGVIKIAKGDTLDERLAGVLELAANSAVLVDAVKDASIAGDEVKELSLDEMNQVIAKLYEISDALRAAKEMVES